ncbi:DDB1- and CUL4-associated factor 7 like protein [Tritrichomonas foetus]|uniref:DDB1- and CUL4-associated factor 7 like protein n=1 Tax=Tritrichomonas foetus TaxID=1144522 RepID=A0A1J4KNM4_9EUKA|nr:DDB1- and CUL4-associated factor 7 like protein [Tritrichomonas foetus]|eukprot:OHT12512.1 DDB1- and CUL4-associated factor 7 like protein [Tritrichomonas foetus]
MNKRAAVTNTIPLPWHPFALACSSSFSKESRLAISSFEETNNNFIKIYRIVGPSFISESTLDFTLPQTCCRFSPAGRPDSSDLLISGGDNIRVWQTEINGSKLLNDIEVHIGEPITCLDWSLYEESLVLAGSTDATATAVDLTSGQTVARIIAHDHPIHDISFCGASSNFITAGFDGSLRFFDLRDLQSSFIYYQTAMPLMRASVSPLESYKMATFSKNSNFVTIIDARRPGVPCAVCSIHKSPVTSIGWSKIQTDMIYSSDSSGTFATSFVQNDELEMDSNIWYETENPIEFFHIGQGIIAMAIDKRVDVIDGFKCPTQKRNSRLNEFRMDFDL